MFFYIFYTAVIVGIVVACFFMSNNKESSTESGEISDVDDITYKEYATSIELNIPRKIYATVGSSFELDNGYYSVVPSYKKSDVQLMIKPNNLDTRSDGCFRNGNTFSVTSAGIYQCVLSIEKSEDEFLTATFYIYAETDPCEPYVSAIYNEYKVGESYRFDQVINIINSNYYMDMTYSNNITINNGLITFLDEDKVTFNFVFKYQHVTFRYSAQLLAGIEKTSKYSFVLHNYTDYSIDAKLISNKVRINYVIISLDDNLVANQDVGVEFEKQGIATLSLNSLAPFVDIYLDAIGETDIKIYSLVDKDCFVVLHLIVT